MQWEIQKTYVVQLLRRDRKKYMWNMYEKQEALMQSTIKYRTIKHLQHLRWTTMLEMVMVEMGKEQKMAELVKMVETRSAGG